MTQPSSPVELARQRDVKAIANLVNSRTTPLNTTTKISLKGDVLQLMLESEDEPDRERLIPIVQGLLVKLKIAGVERVRVYGRSIGQEVPEWTSEFEIIETPATSPAPIPDPAVPQKKIQSFQLTGSASALPQTPQQERAAKSNALSLGISGAIGGVLISLPMVWIASILGLGPIYFIGIGVVVMISYLSGFSQGLKLFDVQCPSCSHAFQISGDVGDCPACRERLFIDDRGNCKKTRLASGS